MLSGFPDEVKRELRFSRQLQIGREPTSQSRSMSSMGSGVYELKEADERAWYRAIYLSKVGNTIYVLRCFKKESRKTVELSMVMRLTTARSGWSACRSAAQPALREQCIAASASMGAFGIETPGEQMMPGFPNLSDEFYAQWHEWMRLYGTVPTCHDAFLDIKKYKGRLLTPDEQVVEVTRDIKHAARLGAKSIRMLVICSPELMERCAPIAADHGIWLGVEVHSPWHIDHEWIQKHLEVAYRVGTDKLGLVPDMGIFVERFPRIIYERYLCNGAHDHLVKMIVERYDRHEDLHSLPGEVEKLGGNAEDVALAGTVGHYVASNPNKLSEVIGAVRHIHGKFYEVTEEGREESIPYERIPSRQR